MNVSVVVASYNHGPFVRECIESALNQTLQPSEVIVVDDGSEDNSWEVISSFGSAVTAIRQDRRGTYGALNAGIARASGDWIAIHNSDDVWEPEKLEAQAENAAACENVGLVHTAARYIDARGEPVQGPPDDLSGYRAPACADRLEVMITSMPVVISSALFSRRALDDVGLFDERFLGGGDWEMCVRVSARYAFGFVDRPLTRVRKHTANASTNASRIPSDWGHHDWLILGRETMQRAARTVYERAREGKSDPAAAAFALVRLATVYAWDYQPDLARRTYALALRLQPSRAKTYLRYAATFLPHGLRTRIR